MIKEIEELIESKNYELAIKKLNNNSELDYYYLSLIYYKLKDFNKALEYINKAIDKANNNYYQSILLKIDILISLKSYLEAIKILDEEIKMPYVPTDILNKLNDKFKTISNLFNTNSTNKLENLDKEDLGEILLNSNEIGLVYNVVEIISKRNIRDYLEYIKKYLISDKSNIIKTILLEEMHNQYINEEIKIIKNDLEFNLVPALLDNVFDTPQYLNILSILDSLNSEHNITISNLSKSMLADYIGDIYPLELDQSEYNYVAIAIFYNCNKLIGINIDLDKYINSFDLNKKILDNYLDIIK